MKMNAPRYGHPRRHEQHIHDVGNGVGNDENN